MPQFEILGTVAVPPGQDSGNMIVAKIILVKVHRVILVASAEHLFDMCLECAWHALIWPIVGAKKHGPIGLHLVKAEVNTVTTEAK